MSVAYNDLANHFHESSFLKDRSWQFSPEPFPIDKEALFHIGRLSLKFYQTIEQLYRLSSENKSLLRNKDLKTPWVADYFNRGKPEYLIRHGLHKSIKNQTPQIIRPDLLITDNGLKLTELDAVPGGIGLTAHLNAIYGISDSTALEFYETVMAGKDGTLAIVISDESADYLPEFQHLTESLQASGKSVHCLHPSQLEFSDSKVSYDGRPIDVIYRFFELFDLDNIPCAKDLIQAVEAKQVKLTPPMKTYHEEKLSFALLHHYELHDFWEEKLGKKDFQALLEIVPKSWILDPTPVLPNAYLNAPLVAGRPIREWESLANANSADRDLIIKISGFHETAWGARSVTYGKDVGTPEWAAAIQHAKDSAPANPFVIQEYAKPSLVKHPVYTTETHALEAQSRVRMCPYFKVNKESVSHLAALITLCPKDKKIIHGMSVASLLPGC